MIDLATASELIDFSTRIGQGPRAEEQLKGAVAVHNILKRHRVAYLADEVGMGKTYVALGALALFRHFKPDFRVVVVAPRENIQSKWMKEFANFARYNVKFPDLRVTSIDRQPARPLVGCDNLLQFVREATVDPRRDFFLRLSSFSVALGDQHSWSRLRDGLRDEVPWLPDGVLDLRSNKDIFKENFARVVCCALPVFDLVIVDEGHNLKHGFSRNVAARNRVLGLAFGRASEAPDRRLFPRYGPRANRVLFLSATPLEESYRHLWNQLDVFDLGGEFQTLQQDLASEEEKRRTAGKFLVRRVTSIQINGAHRTKNQYRREWRGGGVYQYDDPITVQDTRQRLVVALVQKKVAELLGSEKFNMSFQVGMLASFESFLETAKLKRADEEEGNFDDPEQTASREEREGIDIHDVNRLARDYRRTFGRDMPHPKMDALVDALSTSWISGRKALVFVRRIKSVTELKRRLDDAYDAWLIGRLRERLPDTVLARFEEVVRWYKHEQGEAEAARQQRAADLAQRRSPDADLETDDHGGTDTFFAWFFRGDGPRGVISGANVQRRFIQGGSTYSTFFDDNYVMALLDAEPGGVATALGRRLGLTHRELREHVGQLGRKYLSRAKRQPRADRMRAAQAAALELLAGRSDPLSDRARVVWHERFEGAVRGPHAAEAPDLLPGLEHATFFTELRRPERAELRARLWPAPTSGADVERFRELELRRELLATTARLGHSLIDLYVMTVQAIGSLEQRALADTGDEPEEADRRRIEQYLDMLEAQRTSAAGAEWGAFQELAELAANFDLILDVNTPDVRTKPLTEAARQFGNLLRQQQPIGGMFGQVNRSLVQQFRMPGYPFVLITTDLLQEGEDLHTFCSAVHHYGIAWTPSSMEQRIGRIDRVRSLTERRLAGHEEEPSGDELLQVYYPHLEDTVEVLQVQRVLERMNVFLRLMHEGLAVPKSGQRTLDVTRELAVGRRTVAAIRERLQTAFPLPDWALRGTPRALSINPATAEAIAARFESLAAAHYEDLNIQWQRQTVSGQLLGSLTLSTGRVQPFTLLLKSESDDLVIRCISPVGRVGVEDEAAAILETVRHDRIRIGAILGEDESSYDLTVEDDVLLGAPEHDNARVGALLRQVTRHADELELAHLPGMDQRLERFEADLKREWEGGRG